MIRWDKIWLLICNMDTLSTLSPKVAKFLWNECPLKIYLSSQEDVATYWYDGTWSKPIHIELGKFRSRKLRYTALLHEVGHYKDHTILKHRFRKSDQKKCEKAAWKWALRFSEKYQIPINLEVARLWLNTYGAKYKCLDNKVEQNETQMRNKQNRT